VGVLKHQILGLLFGNRHNLDLLHSNSSAGNLVGTKKSSAFSFVTHKEIVDEEGCLVTRGELSWNITSYR
jgi:hypothetical protein